MVLTSDARVPARWMAADRHCAFRAMGDWSLALHGEEFRERCRSISVRMYDDCVVHRNDTGEDCLNRMNQVRDFQMAIARKQAAARALLPIPIGWMVIWLANVMVRSIRRGWW